jgi:hypothetical protein
MTESNWQEIPGEKLQLKNSDIMSGVLVEGVALFQNKQIKGMRFVENTIYSVLGRKLMHFVGTQGYNRKDIQDKFEKDIMVGAIATIDSSLRKSKKMNGALQDGIVSGLMSLVSRNALHYSGIEDTIWIGKPDQ